MFLEFFFLLRARGLKVTTHEWLTLMEALDMGLAHSSLLGFYHLCKCIIIKSETEYDLFDRIFADYFGTIDEDAELPERFWEWLNKPADLNRSKFEFEYRKELEELLEKLEDLKENQKKEHKSGKKYIGAGGTAPIGHSGFNRAGIRAGGFSRHHSAVQIAGERHYRDFREDNILSMRDFQVAFRRLREFSSRLDVPRTELNVEKTVDDTCDNAGMLSIAWDKPRKNTIKLLILFDSDGSMRMYSELCSKLFKSVSISNRFKDLKTYYFHNCIYDYLYEDPSCAEDVRISTKWVLSNLPRDYKVIIVGDGCMALSELTKPNGELMLEHKNEESGMQWLQKFKRSYDSVIWLNPIPKIVWDRVFGGETLMMISEVFPMYELSLNGLNDGIRKLLSYR